MSTSNLRCKATVEGLGKQGNVFTFLLCLEPGFNPKLQPGDSITVGDVPVAIANSEDTYLSFELSLEQLVDTKLAEVTVGSEVTVAGIST